MAHTRQAHTAHEAHFPRTGTFGERLAALFDHRHTCTLCAELRARQLTPRGHKEV